MPYEFIDTQEVGGVLVITMDDAPTRNAIGDEMAAEINAEIDRLEASSTLRALVLTGRDPSFCSGANVKRMNQANEERDESPIPDDQTPWEYLDSEWEAAASGESYMDGVRFLPLTLHNMQKPTIAAVNGYAMGLGMGIALSCDIRIASENARFSETFIRRGLIPADGSCWQLPRMIGISNTFILQYTGRHRQRGRGVPARHGEQGRAARRADGDDARPCAADRGRADVLDGDDKAAGAEVAAHRPGGEPEARGACAEHRAAHGGPQGGRARIRGEAAAEVCWAVGWIRHGLLTCPI